MRVAIVGCGRMGRERARSAAAVGVGAILLFDEDRRRAESLALECPGAQTQADLTSLFEQQLDAIFICTPPWCRGPVENRAINLNIPFFVEKPIGVSAEQVRTVRDRLREKKVTNSVGYMNRYRNSVAHARTMLKLRNLIGITAHWVGRKYSVPWWAVCEQSGGPFNEQATHLTDLVRYLSGEVEPLHGTANRQDGIETTVAATFRLAQGGLGTILYSCEAKDKDVLISVQTQEGVLDLKGWDLELSRNTIDGTYPKTESTPIFEKETAAFLQAVTTGSRSLILADFEDAYKTQSVMDRLTGMFRSEGSADHRRLDPDSEKGSHPEMRPRSDS